MKEILNTLDEEVEYIVGISLTDLLEDRKLMLNDIRYFKEQYCTYNQYKVNYIFTCSNCGAPLKEGKEICLYCGDK